MSRRSWLFALAAALILFVELMRAPVPGVADNADFGKLLGRFGIGSGQTFVYANTKFFPGDQYRYRSGFTSSELLLVGPAVAIGRALSGDGSLDLRIMGAVHASVFLLAIFLLGPALDSAAVAIAALLLFCDFTYAGFFNSFYMDAGALLFTMLAAVFFLRAIRWRRRADAAGMVISMLLAVTATAHYAILAPWFALLVWMGRGAFCAGRKAVAAAVCGVMLCAGWISYRYLVPESYAAKDVFTVIFSQITPNSANARRAMAQLGLDGSYSKWIGLQGYSPGVPWEDAAFYTSFAARTSYWKIAGFYLRHPADAWLALRMALDEAGSFRSPLGNFDSGSGRPPAAHYERFQFISSLKRRIFYQHGGWLFTYLMALAVVVPGWLMIHRKRLPPGALAGGIALSGAAVTMLLVSALADVFDQFRHQILSFALFDVLLLAVVWLVAGQFRRSPVVKTASRGSLR